MDTGDGVGADGGEGEPFRVQPGPCRGRVGHRRGGGGRRGDVGPAALLGWIQGVHCGCGGGQVVIEQPRQRRPPLDFGVLAGVNVSGEVGGVGAQQVVHAITAGAGGSDQVRPGQQVEEVLGPLEAGVGQGGGGVGIKVGAGVQPEQPERPPSVGRQV